MKIVKIPKPCRYFPQLNIFWPSPLRPPAFDQRLRSLSTWNLKPCWLLFIQSRPNQIRLFTSKPLNSSRMDAYVFPDNRLKKKMDNPSKTPLLLVSCGSFSPVTFLHLRMFTMAADYAKFTTDYEIIGGYFSPVSDAYKKAGLASAEHR